ncbi:hypothetical protein ABW19_dt0209880 [Dactylella cylindrospora]|nr:hypothetical protein ABW19_dt0209880 [Dactylella cylindrospora]
MAYRRPNVSQFHANLNLINPMYGAAEPAEETFDQSNLDLFANADFFDWDMGQAMTVGPETEREEKKMDATQVDVFSGETGLEGFDLNSVDFNSLQSYLMSDFTQPQQPPAHIAPAATPSRPQQSQQRPRNLAILPQPPHSSPALAQNVSNFASPVSPASALSTPNPLKRKSITLDSNPSPHSLEDASRAAAEEDKRRRNTAASARFRVKKKQREAALEQHAKDLETKVQELGGRVTTLENENKWLKDLLMEKHGSNEDFIKLIKAAPFPLSSLPTDSPSDD